MHDITNGNAETAKGEITVVIDGHAAELVDSVHQEEKKKKKDGVFLTFKVRMLRKLILKVILPIFHNLMIIQ